MNTSSYILANGLRMHYLHWNLAGGGRPVVLLHGLASNARIWEKVGPRLAERGLAVLAPDGRGHGLTDKPDGDYGFANFSHDLAAFVEALNVEKPVIAGHSWGAQIALDYAARVSFGPRAPAKIIMVDGGLVQQDRIPGATWEATRERLTPPRLAGTPLDEFLERINRAPWGPSEQDIQIILANFDISPDDTIFPRLTFERHMLIVRAMWEFQTYELFGRLHCPVLAVAAVPAEPAGAGERAFLEAKQHGAAELVQRSRQARVLWMADTIHDIPLQKPDELAAAMAEFIESGP